MPASLRTQLRGGLAVRSPTAPLQRGTPTGRAARTRPSLSTAAGPPSKEPGRDWDSAWRDVRKALPPVEPAAGARPRGPVRPLDSRAARQAAARAGVPPAPRFSSGGGSGGRAPPRSSDDDDIRAQERVLLDVWSDARFAAAGGALAGALLLAFLAKADF